jgi:hypothetical protein
MLNTPEAVHQFFKNQRYSKKVIEGGLDYALATWRDNVDRIARGKLRSFDDYLNDMDMRELLYEAFGLMSETEKKPIMDEVAALDQKLLAATIEVPQCIWGLGAGYDRMTEWWYYRLPPAVAEKWIRLYMPWNH